MSEESVNSCGDQHVALGFLILHYMVKVGPCRQHGSFAQAVPTENHYQTHQTEPVHLLYLCRKKKSYIKGSISTVPEIKMNK